MRKNNRLKLTYLRKIIHVFTILSLLLVLNNIGLCDGDSSQLKAAPISEEFKTYIKYKELNKYLLFDGSSNNNGIIPSPMKVFNERSNNTILKNSNLPSRYDLREQGRLTSVKDQVYDGPCWAFSTYGALESRLRNEGYYDFSEDNLVWKHGFNLSVEQGGNRSMSTAYLTRWSGPVSETDDPYSSGNTNVVYNEQKHVQEVLFLPNGDIQAIKNGIINYGAINSVMYVNSYYFNNSTNAYYYNGNSAINHGINIVGWDDNYSKYNFKSTPPGNGAYICKNSWGSNWGDDGYFYISYYDSKVATVNTAYSVVEDVDNYDDIYQYDYLGYTTRLGYSNSTAWFSNVFTAKRTEFLKAVGFYTLGVNSTYEIYVVRNYNNSSNLEYKEFVGNGTIDMAGYHTININDDIKLFEGEKFAVIIKLTTPNTQYPIASEQPVNGYSSGATANYGESYISYNGLQWSDVVNQYNNSNVCLKAYTDKRFEIISVIPDKVSPQEVGTNIKWTAETEGSNLKYRFYIYKDGKQVYKDDAYTTKGYVEYIPESAGSYKAIVYVKDDSGKFDYKVSSDFVIGEIVSFRINGINVDKLSPQEAGTKLKWTTSAQGSNLKYKFYVYKDGSQVYNGGNYTTQNYIEYTPGSAGKYKAIVYVKDDSGKFDYKISSDFIIKGIEFKINGITTDKINPQEAGTKIKWTASAQGSNLKYKFYIYKDGRQVYNSGSYISQNYNEYTPQNPGNYKAIVYVIDDRGNFDYKVSSDFEITGENVSLKVNKMSVDKVSPQEAGTKIKWTALAQGSNLKYKFYIYKDGRQVYNGGSYTSQNYIEYTPEIAGSYKAIVYVIDDNGKFDYKVSSDFIITGQTVPFKVNGISADKVSPQEVGTKIKWTASAQGSNLKYKFYVYKDGSKVYNSLNYTSQNYIEYTPKIKGIYKAIVYVIDGSEFDYIISDNMKIEGNTSQ